MPPLTPAKARVRRVTDLTRSRDLTRYRDRKNPWKFPENFWNFKKFPIPEKWPWKMSHFCPFFGKKWAHFFPFLIPKISSFFGLILVRNESEKCLIFPRSWGNLRFSEIFSEIFPWLSLRGIELSSIFPARWKRSRVRGLFQWLAEILWSPRFGQFPKIEKNGQNGPKTQSSSPDRWIRDIATNSAIFEKLTKTNFASRIQEKAIFSKILKNPPNFQKSPWVKIIFPLTNFPHRKICPPKIFPSRKIF